MEISYNKDLGLWVSKDGKIFREANYTYRGPSQSYKCVRTDLGRMDVHRVVAITFIANPDKDPIVLHLDDNPQNNSVINLRWGTYQDNMSDMIAKGRAYWQKDLIPLTVQEKEVLHLKAYKNTHRAISYVLHVTESRVSQLLASIREKGWIR